MIAQLTLSLFHTVSEMAMTNIKKNSPCIIYAKITAYRRKMYGESCWAVYFDKTYCTSISLQLFTDLHSKFPSLWHDDEIASSDNVTITKFRPVHDRWTNFSPIKCKIVWKVFRKQNYLLGGPYKSTFQAMVSCSTYGFVWNSKS